MSKERQRTLFPEPEPEPTRDGDIDYFGDRLPGDFADYILLEPGEYDDPFATPPAPENLPFGIAAYVQELYQVWRPQVGETLATRRVQRIVNDYHGLEEEQ